MRNHRLQRYVFGLALALFALGASAKQHNILIGGGYELAGSQAQIELNLGWVQQIITAQSEKPVVFYTDGDDPAPDVFWHESVSTEALAGEALARVFGMQTLNRERYRNHALPDVFGSTRRQALEPELRKRLGSLKEGDNVLLVYNGHGAPSEGREDEVALKLWGDTRYSVGDLQDALDESLDVSVPLRYVFTQCYSGGFHRLIYEDSAAGLTLSEPLRCGFTAESAWRQSEGCSASIDLDDYRDYTTFFFAALSGKDRLNRALKSNPDLDDDGVTSLYEAHLYTLEHAHSTDLSRASSEAFLEQHVPFYMSWMSFDTVLPDNTYGALASRLAARLEVPVEAIVSTARQRLGELRDAHAAEKEAQRENRSHMRSLQRSMQAQLLKNYPQLALPYTGGYISLLSEQAEEVQGWIQSQADYAVLVQKQDAEAQFDLTLLELERDMTQLEKLMRLRRLAFYQQWMNTKAEKRVQHSYESLLACESVPLSP